MKQYRVVRAAQLAEVYSTLNVKGVDTEYVCTPFLIARLAAKQLAVLQESFMTHLSAKLQFKRPACTVFCNLPVLACIVRSRICQ